MSWDDELNDRKKEILRSIVDDYIHTAMPVGSRTISKKHELGLSSATIRNEMADLEELGYLAQPHTSAGRVPSDKGYRFYVDNLVQVQNLAMEEMQKIRLKMEDKIGEMGDLVKRVANLISVTTGYATVAMPRQLEYYLIRTIQIVPVGSRRVLVVVVSSGGAVNTQMVRLDSDISDDHTQKLATFLTKKLEGKPINDLTVSLMAEVEHALSLTDGVVLPVAECLRECMRRISHSEIVLEGMTNLFSYPEFHDLIKAREVLELLKEEDVLSAIMQTVGKYANVEMRIGKENALGTMKDLSLVTTSYGDGEKSYGSIGVIGPTRMTYSRVIASMEYIRKLLDREIYKMMNDTL